MILHPVHERLKRNLAYAHQQYLRAVLARRVAEGEVAKAKDSYETIQTQLNQVQALLSIAEDETRAQP